MEQATNDKVQTAKRAAYEVYINALRANYDAYRAHHYTDETALNEANKKAGEVWEAANRAAEQEGK